MNYAHYDGSVFRNILASNNMNLGEKRPYRPTGHPSYYSVQKLRVRHWGVAYGEQTMNLKVVLLKGHAAVTAYGNNYSTHVPQSR